MRLKPLTTITFTNGAAKRALLAGTLFYSLIFSLITLGGWLAPALGAFPVDLERLVYVLDLPLEVVLLPLTFFLYSWGVVGELLAGLVGTAILLSLSFGLIRKFSGPGRLQNILFISASLWLLAYPALKIMKYCVPIPMPVDELF